MICRGLPTLDAGGLRYLFHPLAVRAVGGIHAAWRDSKQFQETWKWTLQEYLSLRLGAFALRLYC
jgi:hypothetical protein